MDYEKLHKDTIAKLQEMVNSGKITVEVARGICADFIPESEDERIRKELLNYLYDAHDDDEERASWIAWLGKQELLTKEKALKNSPFVEQKPAWSEEDEKMVNYITIDIEELIEQNAYDETQLRKEIDWLKSLRLHFCDYHEGFKKGFAKAQEMHYDHWKPSDEQMLALEGVLTISPQSPAMTAALIELYEQLKELKG